MDRKLCLICIRYIRLSFNGATAFQPWIVYWSIDNPQNKSSSSRSSPVFSSHFSSRLFSSLRSSSTNLRDRPPFRAITITDLNRPFGHPFIYPTPSSRPRENVGLTCDLGHKSALPLGGVFGPSRKPSDGARKAAQTPEAKAPSILGSRNDAPGGDRDDLRPDPFRDRDEGISSARSQEGPASISLAHQREFRI